MKKSEVRSQKSEVRKQVKGIAISWSVFVSCFLFLVAGFGSSIADEPQVAPDRPEAPPEPPVRLKKKVKPMPAEQTPDKKTEEKTDPPRKQPKDGDPDPASAERDPKETLAKITKNMRTSEDRLAQKDPGDGTRQIQRDIVKDLDSLIEQTQKQQQQQSSGSSSSSARARRAQQGAGSKNNPKNQSATMPSPRVATRGLQENNSSKDDKSKIADLYKDIWGHLPETLRQEMDSYSREEFMAKYSELLKQYYTTIAEKGRKKGD